LINTLQQPYLQNPLDLGADAMHLAKNIFQVLICGGALAADWLN
jgi:hypothetical protein